MKISNLLETSEWKNVPETDRWKQQRIKSIVSQTRILIEKLRQYAQESQIMIKRNNSLNNKYDNVYEISYTLPIVGVNQQFHWYLIPTTDNKQTFHHIEDIINRINDLQNQRNKLSNEHEDL